MSSSWVIKTRQMSEAGKEIILREALATRLRTSRDRERFAQIHPEGRTLAETFAMFAAFYLHTYQGVRLHQIDETQELTIEAQEALDDDARSQLEEEVRFLLGNRQREEIAVSRLVGLFTLQFCDELGSANPKSEETIDRATSLLNEHLARIPDESSPNNDVDFLNQVAGYASAARNDLYIQASGLKETALSLRDELLREHDAEVAEITTLKRGLARIWGSLQYSAGHLATSLTESAALHGIAFDVANRLCGSPVKLDSLRVASKMRIALVDALEPMLGSPITIDDYEARLSTVISDTLPALLEQNPRIAFDVLSAFTGVPASDVEAGLRRKGITNPADLLSALRAQATEAAKPPDETGLSKDELEHIERQLKRIDKIEHTLEGQVKGMLRARGLRDAELKKFTIETLAKDRTSLLGIEIQILEALEEKIRVPPPEEVERLLENRRSVKEGSLSSIGVTSTSDMIQQRAHGESAAALRADLVWYFTSGILTNVSRVVESYIRSKQDLLRIKALLKSIYDSSETELQALREEILIDLMSERIYELKVVYPELEAESICSWMHARLSNQDMEKAKEELLDSPSPVFEGVVDAPLVMEKLEFDNYAIAYDLMHRFLVQERKKKLAKEELALQTELEDQRIAESKKASLDVLSWIYTKSQTVFRAIGRVGVKGLEWTETDDSKCANLLAYYIKTNRRRKVCTLCGSAPSDGKCKDHGSADMVTASDLENLAIFVMRGISDIKTGLIGPSASGMSMSEARSIVDREVSKLKRQGKLTSRTNLRELMPGEINYIVGPAIAKVIGKYFNDSLSYAARRVDFA
ncbi:MAG: hypothetical protein EAX95_06600 [Candidatus Thorarchaeota archaeon]|nr:hypothetical protein [Candidatus Thorarchaeota archaeon]